MPFTVTCPACDSRFSLGDDLFRRKVAGNVVTVRCRHCSAEIAVDATSPVTLPSNEAPRRAPSPPRPKGASVTQMGLGLPPPVAGLGATTSPLPLPRSAISSPLPLPRNASATATPLGFGRPPKPVPASEALSIWDAESTVSINAPKAPPAKPHAPHPHPHPHPPSPHRAQAEEPELIEAEEIPASSSDAPTLDALTLEATRPIVPRAKRPPDEFLVNLSAGTQGILGAPTIDVSAFSAPTPVSDDVDVVEDEEVEFHDAAPAPRSATVPLFDMSAVLPAASEAVRTAATPARAEAAKKPDAIAPAPESKARERKFVVAPETAATTATASPPKTRRGGAGIWFGLVAIAAGIVAVVGLRGHRAAEPVASEPHATVEPAAAPLLNANAPAAAAPAALEPTSAASEAPSAAPSSAATTASAANPPTTKTAAKNTDSAPTPASTPSVKAEPAETPKAEAEPAPAKTAEIAKPAVVAHNAPPPAADGTEFDRAAARTALANAAAQASACRKDGDPSGTASITITFAPSGRITSANLQGPPFAGTATGGCIASAMRRATVPAFSGEHVTVTKTIVVQ